VSPAAPPRPARAARLLHTSDWHLGVTVRDQSRSLDHDAAIAELVAVAEAARPDLILHTGDLFDGPRPPMSEFGRAIRALRALGEVAPVVLLAGNHDSSVALEVLGLALGDGHPDDVAAGRYDPFATCRHRVRVHPKPSLPEAGAVATYATAAGWDLRLAALPFVHANRVLTDFAALSEPNATYNDSLRRVIGHLTSTCLTGFDPARQVAVFASHLHIAGARTSSEREIHIATGYATDPAHLDPAYGYLAFGHIHVPQAVAGGRGRYAGSILEVDFGEEGETKQVGIVDLEPGRPTAVTSIPLVAPRRLRRLRASLSELRERAAEVRGDLVEVTIGPEPGGAPVDRDAAIFLDGDTYDTLSQAVRAVLPDVAVVGVVDARNPAAALADELPQPGAVETVDDTFNAWLVDGGAGLLARNPFATVGRVAELFAELRAAAGSADADGPALPEVAALKGVLTP
jgi:exonuclease SbcD